MNELLDTLFGNGFTMAMPEMPRTDIVETKDSYQISMDLPGLSETDVAVDLKDNQLTIASAKKESDEKQEWIVRERRPMNFSRSFTLPEDVAEDGITAALKNGVLTVSIPRKAVENKNRSIAVIAA